jgi:hypothetical protein
LFEQIFPISTLEKNKEYVAYGRYVEGLMRKRTLKTKALIRKLVNHYFNKYDFALCLKGSYGMHVPNIYSDLDFVIISDTKSLKTKRQSDILFRSFPEYKVSFNNYSTVHSSYDKHSPSFWLSIPNLSFIVGEIQLYEKFLSLVYGTLGIMPLEYLLSLFSEEFGYQNRSDITSPHFYNMKRGVGGTLEYEFICLLRLWQKQCRYPFSTSQNRLFQLLTKYYRYTTFLKEYLRQLLNRPIENRKCLLTLTHTYPVPWYFTMNITNSMAIALHDYVILYVSTISNIK